MSASPSSVESPVREERVTPVGDAAAPYHVILYNDDIHAFDDVVRQVQLATGMPAESAAVVTLRAHEEGRAVCYEGERAPCETVAAILRQIALHVEVDQIA